MWCVYKRVRDVQIGCWKTFLLSNLINYNYFLRKSICITPVLVIKVTNVFCVFFLVVFKRFCLTFKVVHVHESISYVILHLCACSICLFVWLYLILCVCICVCRPHIKGEYTFTKTFVFIKGIKEGNIFCFLERQSLLI